MTRTKELRSVGGPLRANVTLRVQGEDLDPDRVSRLLGVRPTYAHRKGDLVGKRSLSRRSKGIWMLEFSENRLLEELLRELLVLLPDEEAWQAAIRGTDADVYCTVDLDVDVGGFVLAPDVLAALGRRGLSISIEIYSGDTRNEEPDTEGPSPATPRS